MFQLGGSERTKKLEEHSCLGAMGERSFSVAGPKLWNFLQKGVRMEEEKDKLKTGLFRDLDNLCSKF